MAAYLSMAAQVRRAVASAGRAAVVLTATTLSLAQIASLPHPPSTTVVATPPRPALFAPGEVLIKFKPGTVASERSLARSQAGAAPRARFRSGAEQWTLPPGLSTEEAIARLRSMPGVEYVEPNYLLTADRIPDDPRFPEQWALGNHGQTGGKPGADIDASRAWNITTGDRQVLVAIIDSGVDIAHPDLARNIFTNPGEIPGNGLDDDGNGFVDDVHGWDFANGDNDPFDDAAHGTHVAGILGAFGGDGRGIAGINWQVSILPAKFLRADGTGFSSEAIHAIDYAVAMHALVMNNSWGGGAFSHAMQDAIAGAGTAGALFVVSAGNASNDNDETPQYPASYPQANIVAVAATDANDELAVFSSYGARTVLLGAPGVSVQSTLPGGTYGLRSGTSMAAPMVSGAAALLHARFPGIEIAEIKRRLLESADPVPALQGRTLSGGRLNIFKMMAEPDAVPPGTIDHLRVEAAGSSSVSLRFTATGDDGAIGHASTYEVRAAPSGGAETTFLSPIVPAPSGQEESLEVPGLLPLTGYTFMVRALDEWDAPGPFSDRVATTTLEAPTYSASPSSLSLDLLRGQIAALDIVVRNAGAGTLDWHIAGGGAGDARLLIAPWLAAEPVAGRLAAGAQQPVRVTFDATALAAGNHASIVAIASNDPLRPLDEHPASLEVTDAPAVLLQPGRIDFGTLLLGTASTQPLRVRNIGTTDLTVTDVATGNDALSVDATSFVLEPDGERSLMVTYRPAVPGALQADLVVASDASNGSVAGIAVIAGAALAPPGIEVAPAAIAERLSSGDAAIARLTIGNPGASDLTLRLTPQGADAEGTDPEGGDAGAPPGWVKVTPATAVVPPGGEQVVEVTLDGTDLAAGDYDAALRLDTNIPGAPASVIPIALTVLDAPHLRVEGLPVLLESRRHFTVDGATTPHRLATPLLPAGGGTLELQAEGDFGNTAEKAELVVEGAGFGATGGIGGECGMAERTVEISAATLRGWLEDGAIDAEVRNSAAVGVACDLNRHTLRVRYTAASDRLEFGAIVAGSRSSRRLILRNTGSRELHLLALRADRPEIELAGGSAGAMAPGSSRILDVQFVAASEGPFQALLGIDSDDPGSPHRDIPIGAGVTAPPAIVATPAAIAASLLEGRAVERSLTLTNPGERPLELSLRVGDGAGASGTGTPACAPTAWLTAGFSSGNLLAVDAATGVSRPVASGLFGPGAVAVDPIGRRVVATEFNSRLAVADLAGGPVTRFATGSGNSFGVILDPSGKSAYVAGDGSGGIVRIDLATGATTPIAADLEGPRGLAIDVAGRSLWVVESVRGALSEVEIATGAVRLIADGLPDAFGLAVDRQGSRAYVSLSAAGAVVAIDLTTGDVTPIASGLLEPRGLALDDRDGILLVAEFAGARLSAIDLATGQARVVAQGVAQASGAAFDQPSACLAGFVGLGERSIALAGGEALQVPVELDSTGLTAGPHDAVIEVGTARPFVPLARVPVSLTVAPRPRLEISGLEVALDSAIGFTTTSARTVHRLPVGVPPGSAGTLEVTLDGDFGNATERATLTLEGTAIGSVGNNGTDCTPALGRFEIAAPLLAAAAADGSVEISVVNSATVNPTCSLNRHRVKLRYRSTEPAGGLEFGALQAGASRSIPIVLGNTGSLPLHVASITIASPEFVVTEAGLSLAPGETRTIEVRAAPTAPGTVEGVLRVASDDPDRPVAEVRLRATGLEADGDHDGVPDRIDVCPLVKDPAQSDRDADGRGDLCDNCPDAANAAQGDANADGSGDACQPVVVVTGVREDGGARLEVEALASDPQGEPLRGAIMLTPIDPAAPSVSVPFEGGLPRITAIAGLAPEARVRLTLTVTDGNTVPVAATAEFLYHAETILVIDNAPVPAIAAPTVTECDRPNGGVVRLDAGDSGDPDSTPGTADDIVAYAWSLVGQDGSRRPLGTGALLDVFLALGRSTIALVATDSAGESAEATAEVTVRDTSPPALQIVASPQILWPPDRRDSPVRLSWVATDLCDPEPVVTLASARSSEGSGGGGDGIGAFTPDAGGGGGTILLRAERAASGSGRLYVVTLSVRDQGGNAGIAETVVSVPHDLSR